MELPSDSPPPPVDTVILRCPGCGTEGAVVPDTFYECTICGGLLDPARDQVKAHHVRRGMIDRLTGMRKRRRKSMGFKRAGTTELGGAHDPELAGRRMEKFTGQWMDEFAQPWEAETDSREQNRRWFEFGLAPTVLVILLSAVLLFWGWRAWRGGSAAASLVTEADDFRSDFERRLNGRVMEAEKIARRFLQAGSVEALRPLVRNRERVQPAMQAWYRDAPPFSAPLRGVKLHSAALVPGSVFLRLLAETADFHQVVVTLEETKDGWLVDWESFVAWSEVSWEQNLAKGQNADGKPALVRGYLRLTDWYEPPFTPERQQSCSLRSPGGSVVLPAWMDADPLALMLLRGAFFDAGTVEIEIIARVQPVPGGSPGRLEITEILQTGWILWEHSPGVSGVIFKTGHRLEEESGGGTGQ